MCGRYALTTPVEALRQLFRFAGPALNLRPRWNVAPTQEAAVVRLGGGGERELSALRWGLVPYWAEDRSIGSKMINARAETVATKPAFRAAYKARRCLVPADGFYEWQTVGATRPKQPVLLRLKDGAPFAFAGLWERWVPPEGGTLETFAIITTDANQFMAQFHHRSPVVVAAEDHAQWLDPGADAANLLRPSPSEWWQATRVSTWVNDVKHDDEKCVEPVAAGEMLTGTTAPGRSRDAAARGKKKDDRQTSLF
ncbi:MAG TPA: SOS response-associated peptidase [Alphaproteobacteria bacterium]|nr:SOS response-associated peptidase [Alphaproteobacteria bacterium]